MNEKRIKKSKLELERELKEQLDLLNTACEKYDEGKRHFGKSIAGILRILLSDGKQSRSLLEQLSLRIYFYDSAGDISDTNLATSSNLIALRLQVFQGVTITTFVPNLGGGPIKPKLLRFADWWNKVVIKDMHGRVFTRKDLVHNVADTDGGAHVDPGLDPHFQDLSRDNSLGWNIFDGNDQRQFDERPELPCLRQIAYEVIISVEKARKIQICN